MPVGIIRIEGPYTTAERDALTGMPPNMMIVNSDTGFEWWNDGAAAWQSVPADNVTFVTVTVTSSLLTDVLNNRTGSSITVLAHIEMANRFMEQQGTDVAAAGDLTLPINGNSFEVTGATQIDAINTTDWNRGSVVTLLFASTPTVKHNTAGGAGTIPILLEGAVDFVASAGDTLTLRYSEIGGVNAWRQIGRAVI